MKDTTHTRRQFSVTVTGGTMDREIIGNGTPQGSHSKCTTELLVRLYVPNTERECAFVYSSLSCWYIDKV